MRTTRLAARTTAVTAPLAVSLVLAGAAHADAPATWEAGGDGINGLEALLIFGGIPLGLLIVIALLASISSRTSSPRSRPAQSWEGESEWFGAPDAADPVAIGTGLEVKPGGGASATW